MTTAPFSSAADAAEQVPRLEKLPPGRYGSISSHEPNCGFVVGRDAALAVDTRATPSLAHDLLSAVRSVTDWPARYVFLSHVPPFDVVRAREELPGVEHPAVRTAERDKARWNALRG